MQGLARWQAARRGRTLARFLSLGAPGCLGAVMECSGWEVTTAMAAYLGTLQVTQGCGAGSRFMTAAWALHTPQPASPLVYWTVE